MLLLVISALYKHAFRCFAVILISVAADVFDNFE